MSSLVCFIISMICLAIIVGCRIYIMFLDRDPTLYDLYKQGKDTALIARHSYTVLANTSSNRVLLTKATKKECSQFARLHGLKLKKV